MNDVETWLESIKLSDYVSIFKEQRIGLDDLGSLTESDLKELGLPIGRQDFTSP